MEAVAAVLNPEHGSLPLQGQADSDGPAFGGETQGVGQEVVNRPLHLLPVQIADPLPMGRGIEELNSSLSHKSSRFFQDLSKEAAHGGGFSIGLVAGQILFGICHIVDNSQELEQALIHGGHLLLQARGFGQFQLGEELTGSHHSIAQRLPELSCGQSQLL